MSHNAIINICRGIGSKRRNALTAAAMLCLLVSACHKHEEPAPAARPGTESPAIPGSGGDTPAAPDSPHDMTQALKSAELRYESADLKLLYEQGGIVFEHDNEGRRRIIDLTDGHIVEFVADSRLLTVDGDRVELSYCAEAARRDGVVWYNLTRTADGSQIVLVAGE